MTLGIYKMKTPKRKKQRLRRDIKQVRSSKDDLPLTGEVRKIKASDIEERVARAARKANKRFEFQVEIPVETSLPDQPKEVDFVFGERLKQPVEVYGEIGHSTSSDRANDAVREGALNEAFRRMGWLPLKVLWWWELSSQSMADRVVRRT
jgi:hypothetical protein